MPREESKTGIDKEVYLTHVFKASRERVFAAWTDPQQLLQWFAPDGCTIRFRSIDVCEGGCYHSCIHDPVNGDCWCKGTYLELSVPERIVYTVELTDENGSDLRHSSLKGELWPLKTIVTVTFAVLNGMTAVSLRQTVSRELAARTGALPSWIKMLNRLSNNLEQENIPA